MKVGDVSDIGVPRVGEVSNIGVPRVGDVSMDTSKQQRFRYVPKTERFHENEWATVFVPDFSGPLNFGGSFSFFGSVRVTSNNYVEVDINASTGLTGSEDSPEIQFFANATLQKNGKVLASRSVTRHMSSYLHSSSTFIIGEASFLLPEPTDNIQLILTIEGSYTASVNGGSLRPINYKRFGPAKIKKDFLINVTEE